MTTPSKLVRSIISACATSDIPVSALTCAGGRCCLRVDIHNLFRGLSDCIRIVTFEKAVVPDASPDPEGLKLALIKDFAIPDNALAIILHTNADSLDEKLTPSWVIGEPTSFMASFAQGGSAFLKQFVIARFPLALLNPYTSESSAPEPMFFGRTEETRDLCAHRAHYIIVGPRRGGKTSLARHVCRLLRRDSRYRIAVGGRGEDATSVYSAAYVDLQSLTNLACLWEAVLRNMGVHQRELVGNTAKKLALGPRRKIVEKPPFELLCDLLQHRFARSVLIFDEVDPSIDADRARGWPTFAKLRALADNSDIGARVIVLGYDRLYWASKLTDFPLHGRFRLKRLGNLGPEAVEELVRLPMEELGLTLDQPAQIVRRIDSATGGMPNLIQDVCRLLVDRPEAETRRIVSLRATKDLLEVEGSALIRSVCYGFEEIENPVTRLVAYLAALRTEIRFDHMLESIRKDYHVDVDDQATRAAFDDLLLHSVFQESEAGRIYSFASELLQRELATACAGQHARILIDAIVASAKKTHGSTES